MDKNNLSRFQKIFGSREPKPSEDIPILDAKGQKTFGKKHGRGTATIYPDISPGAIEKQLFANESGPRMLPRVQRFKVWAALTLFGGWCFGCFSLVAYRLRSDDLELMEREVYEELKTKKEVKRLQERHQLEDNLSGKQQL